ncbi:MAG: chemotaxis protein CheC [Burkholderiales bacterium]|jgi:chemotaxis protein CheC|nr:chemotaxis protein CheC [Burkholderiales bacterium]MBP7521938.1 chemotaxis protein CheC [Leptothrix sp. (in: b-proteobacteria)]HQY09516.1 chemotaxis protein CheC [Burkholderiaceae bacterium]
MIHLDEDTSDALAEAFNLALGEAAASFAEIVQEEIVMTVPVVELLPRTELVSRLQLLPREGSSPGGKLCSIAQRFDRQQGGLSTEAILLFPEHGSLEIVRRMLGDSSPSAEQISELEQDALAEVGNIIINSCMNSLAQIFGTEMIGTLPGVRSAQPDELFAGHPGSEMVLMARIGMNMLTQQISGYVLFVMEMSALQTGIEQIRNFFALDAQPA